MRKFSGTTSRRLAASLVAAVTALTGAACGGTSGPSSSSSSSGLTMWALSDQTILKDSVDAYNKDHPDQKITLQLFSNDTYKDKLRLAFGAGQAPDIFFSWGGGVLDDYVKAGKVDEITAADVDTSRFTASVMKATTFDGKVYGIPANGLAPVVLYYNKQVLRDAGLQPPTSYDQLTADVAKLKAKGVTPISLAAGSKWPTLMYLEYLLDRIGGSQVFDKIASGEKTAWTDPAVTKANQMLQDLAKSGAFGTNASSVGYDQGASTALLYTGKAAFELMGTWEYANIAKAEPKMITSGNLGYTSFPAVTGGAGSPADLAGNLSNFLSVNSATKNKAAALTYLKSYVLNDAQIDEYLKSGSVPPVNGLDAKLAAGTSDKDWLTFVYHLVQKSAGFQLSWDQDLPSNEADPLLTNVDNSFLSKITPQQFGENMSKQ
jgi:raffinose/stachyose/melibiose transport system substrate-binding protein